MTITTHTKTITTVNKNTNKFNILCFSDLNSVGGYDPSVYFSTVLQFPAIIDNVSGLEGEALVGKVDENVLVELNKNGELLINAYHEPSSRYSKGGTDDADLIYNKPDFIPTYDNDYNEDYLHNISTHINDRILGKVGDSIVVVVNSIISGKITITAFSETLNGITANRYVSKRFRISLDNIFWSEWLEFTPANICSVQHLVENNFYVQIKYTREGSDTTGEIEFENVNFIGDFESVDFSMPTIENSIFNGIIGTPEFIELENNIFKKLYFRGIIPDYIKRGENRSYQEDKDYIELTKSIARFFCMIFTFFKRWEKFPENEDMLREQLNSYGINFDESKITYDELRNLCENIYSDIARRGTRSIFTRRGSVLPNLDESVVDGELVRLLRSTEADELLYEVVPNYKAGWCLGQCSPLYKGTCESIQLNKTKENTKDFQKKTNFVTCGDVTIAPLNGKRVLKVTNSPNIRISGLGRLNDEDVSDKLYTADAYLDYEIVFMFCIKNINVQPFYPLNNNFIQDILNSDFVNVFQKIGQPVNLQSDTHQKTYVVKVPKETEVSLKTNNSPSGKFSVVITDINKIVLEYYEILNSEKLFKFNIQNEDTLLWVTNDSVDMRSIQFTNFDNGVLHFGAEGFNVNKVKFYDTFSEINGYNSTEKFFSVQTNKFVDGAWYKCRGVVHAYNSKNYNMKTNIGFGSDLLFNNPFTKYMLPKIQLEGDGFTELNIWDYKIRPLIRGANIIPLKDGKETARALGFIECSPLSYTYARSNNNNQSVDFILEIIEKYLYNYETLDLFTILSNF